MEYKEFSGKTIDDALTAASVTLGVTSDQITYEVVEKGSNGLFGIGSKDAVIKAAIKVEEEVDQIKEDFVNNDVKVESPKAEADHKVEKSVDVDDVKALAKDFLDEVFQAMNLEVTIDMEFDADQNFLNIDLKGPEMGIIIGKRGQTLDSVQYLTNLAVNRKADSYIKVKIDTEDYRRRRKDTLENFANNIAHKVKRTGKSVSLEAMNPYERRIIHAALANNRFVDTHSEGEEPYRHVVVTLKK
ncbi:spoIIIJ-associated protein [Lachnospiraceae bacterium A10]|nr:spoIIIJ-associated protein [Lachnospiraceae bacterium A10]